MGHARKAKHRLVLRDRGLGHVHRWQSTCICGWVAVFRRRKCDAKTIYHEHVTAAAHGGYKRAVTVRERRLTPRSELPELLQ